MKFLKIHGAFTIMGTAEPGGSLDAGKRWGAEVAGSLAAQVTLIGSRYNLHTLALTALLL